MRDPIAALHMSTVDETAVPEGQENSHIDYLRKHIKNAGAISHAVYILWKYTPISHGQNFQGRCSKLTAYIKYHNRERAYDCFAEDIKKKTVLKKSGLAFSYKNQHLCSIQRFFMTRSPNENR